MSGGWLSGTKGPFGGRKMHFSWYVYDKVCSASHYLQNEPKIKSLGQN